MFVVFDCGTFAKVSSDVEVWDESDVGGYCTIDASGRPNDEAECARYSLEKMIAKLSEHGLLSECIVEK